MKVMTYCKRSSLLAQRKPWFWGHLLTWKSPASNKRDFCPLKYLWLYLTVKIQTSFVNSTTICSFNFLSLIICSISLLLFSCNSESSFWVIRRVCWISNKSCSRVFFLTFSTSFWVFRLCNSIIEVLKSCSKVWNLKKVNCSEPSRFFFQRVRFLKPYFIIFNFKLFLPFHSCHEISSSFLFISQFIYNCAIHFTKLLFKNMDSKIWIKFV